MRRMQLPRVLSWSARLLSLMCLLWFLAVQAPVALAEGTPGTPQPKGPPDVVREMAPPPADPPLGGRAAREKARDTANENVRKADQERQKTSNDATQNPNDATKQQQDLEAQQKLDQAVTDAAKLTDSVRQANQAYQDAHKLADKAVNDPNVPLSEAGTKIKNLSDAKNNYETKLEEEKAKIARQNAPNWNRGRFAELMERLRQRQATQQGTQGTPQTQPGGATPGSGAGGNIGQTQTPPTAAQVPKINVIEDVAGGGEGYNTSGYKIGWSGSYGKQDWSKLDTYQYAAAQQPDDSPAGGPKVAPVEYVRVCDVYGSGFFYIPGTDTCLKLTGYVRADLGTGVRFEFQADNNQYIGLRSREVITLPGTGVEKNTESGFQYGTLRCFRSIDGGCTIPVTPEQASAFGVPDIVGNVRPGLGWGTFQVQGGYGDFQYGGSVAETTGQSTFPRVLVPQGFQADAYDFSVGDRTFRRFGYRCTRGRPLVNLVNILQMTYSRLEDDSGRDKEPALDAFASLASGHSEKLPQARLDLRSPPMRMRGRR
jgi:hypothetical protein